MDETLIATTSSAPVVNTSLDASSLAKLVRSEHRPGSRQKPWVVVNMVTSMDGATAVGGVSGELTGPGDKAAFHALRSCADVILAGSHTVTAENYRPAKLTEEEIQTRQRANKALRPLIATLSNHGDVDISLPFFAKARQGEEPIVITSRAVDEDRQAALAQVAHPVPTGDELLDLAEAIHALGSRFGASVILVEGGPIVNGLLLQSDLIDEWCITISPYLVAGHSKRAAVSTIDLPLRHYRLDRMAVFGSELVLRYLRQH
ncbi:MAG: dihydrofolate reductase family protein [Acidimicrobiia bacterium]